MNYYDKTVFRIKKGIDLLSKDNKKYQTFSEQKEVDANSMAILLLEIILKLLEVEKNIPEIFEVYDKPILKRLNVPYLTNSNEVLDYFNQIYIDTDFIDDIEYMGKVDEVCKNLLFNLN